MDALNDLVARWWAEWLPADNQEAFKRELLARLPDGDYWLYSDYDPSEGPLLDAVRAAGLECRGSMFSSKDIGFPTKTGTSRKGDEVMLKWGYGAPFEALAEAHIQEAAEMVRKET